MRQRERESLEFTPWVDKLRKIAYARRQEHLIPGDAIALQAMHARGKTTWEAFHEFGQKHRAVYPAVHEWNPRKGM